MSHRGSPDRSTRRAVVIGGSLAGLVTARVLHETFDEVIVLDRDTLPGTAVNRRGAPQGRHAHGLLARGVTALDELFDGFTDEIVAAGGLPTDMQNDLHWYFNGRLLAPARSDITGLAVSRPLLEFLLRARVAALPRVRIIDDCAVIGLLSRDGTRVDGVRTLAGDRIGRDIEGAALVVDAGGRASRSPAWLTALRWPQPGRQEVSVDLTYVSRRYRRDRRHVGGRIGTAYAAYPGRLHGGFVTAEEDERMIASLIGWFGAVPPTEPAAMTHWAAQLASPDIAEVTRGAEPVGPVATMRFPRSIRHEYENMPDFPAGYLVTGDALCSFNPIYGQGMTVLALQGLLLRRLLADGPERIAERFFPAAAELIDTPWNLSTGNDRHFMTATGSGGSRPAPDGMIARVLDRAVHDPALAAAFLRVTNLLEPPNHLMAEAA